MSIDKHANTYFPGDKVRQTIVKGDGTKTAGNIKGEVVDGDPSSGKLKVKWPDGSNSWMDPSEIQKDG